MHVLEWYVQHHTLPVDVARQTIEDQRRRILFELDAPIPVGDSRADAPQRRRPSSRVEQLQQRMQALRAQMASEPDGGRRLQIRDQIVELGRQIQSEQRSDSGRDAT